MILEVVAPNDNLKTRITTGMIFDIWIDINIYKIVQQKCPLIVWK